MRTYYPTSRYVDHGLSTYAEQRGVLHTCNNDGEHVTLEGWFMLSEDGQRVLARKIKGRKVWHYASESNITQFCRTHY